MSTESRAVLRIPYTQQFSPLQTPLTTLLPILRQHARAGKSDALREAIASAFFKGTAAPKKIAGNTLIALKSYAIIDENNVLTELGKRLVDLHKKPDDAHRLLAQHILLDLDGMPLVETLKEMARASLPVNLNTLPEELRQRGFAVSRNSSDLSGVLGWLREAKVLDGYEVKEETYGALVGSSSAMLDVAKFLTSDQIAFLRAMVALNVTDWTPYNSILKHAEELYSGQVHFNWKMIVSSILEPLQKAGLIEYRKQPKRDSALPAGRGGKTADVRPTAKFDAEFAGKILEALYRSAGFSDIRAIRSMSLKDIVADVRQKGDINRSGKALELLSIRLCQLLDLDFMGWRETDSELAGGGEVDGMLHSTRLIYSRWQLQCKVGGIALESVAKEVGLKDVTLANVILIVSTGKATDKAKTFRTKVVSSSNLNIIFIDGTDLNRIVNDNSVLVEILKEQARNTLGVKPTLGNLKNSPPSGGNDSSGIFETGENNETSELEAENKISEDGSAQLPLNLEPAYSTDFGQMYCGDALQILPALAKKGIRVKLIVTSPPFALVRKKAYGNEDSDSYLHWFEQFIPSFKQILDPKGSLVIDLGGAWIKGIPAKSVYQYRVLLNLCESGFYLAEDFYHYNPAKLPTPAEWVTVRRLRVKDAINNVWWLVLDPFVDADNRQVLKPYSESMKALLKNGYKPALRPSGHDISDKFQNDNSGAIPPNLFQFSNTESNSYYLRKCKEKGIKPHPARFPSALPEFFIKLLTQPGDLVLDPFAGSNVTGAVAESMGRQWLGTELDPDYVTASKFRFEPGAYEGVGSLAKSRRAIGKDAPRLFDDPGSIAAK